MGYECADVYYQPEKFGLTPVAEIDLSSGSYEFHIVIVWRHEEGMLYWASDSGCSCPSPFQDYTSLEDCQMLSVLNWPEFRAGILGMDYVDPSVTHQQIDTFLQKVEREVTKEADQLPAFERELRALSD